ncbi:MAG TPA: GDSL-type esterase/lipase family protein [Nevskiaceae bacterium]|nr:GDSL-type esterase/lipase family protein [Nevskiaceae bacterium]
MLGKLKIKMLERFYMRKAWREFRGVIEAALVPGSGGVAFIGDSLTHLGRWELMFPQAGARNFGIGGERAEHVLARLDPVIALRPRQAFLLIGTNDLAYGHGIEDIARRVDEIIGRLAAALPDCRLHLQGLLPRQKKFSGRILQLNQLYEEIARRRGVAFIDLFPRFADADGQLRAELTGDGLHLLGAGYQVWREELARWVRPA